MSGFALSMAVYAVSGICAGVAGYRIDGRVAGPSFWFFNAGIASGSIAVLARMLFEGIRF